jgi:O-antigen/teichoic acid export membrane protein
MIKKNENNFLKKILTNKELHWTMAFQATTLLGALLLIKLLAVSLTKEDFGYYSLIMSISAFILMLPFTALLQGVIRYIPIYRENNNFLTSIFVLFLIIIIFYAAVSLTINSLYLFDHIWEDKYFSILALVISEIIKTILKTISNSKRERKNIAIATFIEFFIKLTIIYIGFTRNDIDLNHVIVALFISNIVSIVYMLKNHHIDIANIKIKYFKIYNKRIWLFSYPLVIWGIFGWFRDMSNRWYIDYFLDKEQVALFTMMSSMAIIVPMALQGIISSFFIPILYQKEGNEKGYTKNFLRLSLPIVSFIFIFIFIFIFFYKNEVILLLADEKYLSVSWMMPWMLLSYSLTVVAAISTFEIFAKMQTKHLVWSSILPGIFSVIGGYFFIKNYGIEGALYNYIITYTSYALLTFLVVIKYWKRNDNY